MGSVGGGVCVLKKPVVRNNIHSVWGDFSVSMFISRPKRAKWLERRLIPLYILVLNSKTNATLST